MSIITKWPLLRGAISICFAMLCGSLSAGESSLLTVSQPHMGTIVRIVADCDSEEDFKKATDAAFQRIRDIEQICSDYRSDSEVLQLSAQAPTAKGLEMSEDLWNVLLKAQQVNHASNGAFDVTVGPLTKEWRRFRRRHEIDRKRIEELLPAVGAKNMTLNETNHTVSLNAPNMRIDLGGIAKGYAIDGALATLKQHGITRALVDAGGDIAVSDAPRGEPGWRVAIGALDPKKPPILLTYKLANAAVATSGDAYQFLEVDGKRYSHILDPRTGYGVDHRGTVTVFANNATEADAWASALSVLGPDKSADVLPKQPTIAAWMEVLIEEKPRTWVSPNLGGWLDQHVGAN